MSPIGSRTVRACLLLCLPGALTPLGAQSGRAKTSPAHHRGRPPIPPLPHRRRLHDGPRNRVERRLPDRRLRRRRVQAPGPHAGRRKRRLVSGGAVLARLAGRPVAVDLGRLDPRGSAWTTSSPGSLAPHQRTSLDVVYGGSANDPAHWIDAAQASGKVVVLDLRPDTAGKRDAPPLGPIVRAPQFSGAAAIAVVRLDGLVARRDRQHESLYAAPRHQPDRGRSGRAVDHLARRRPPAGRPGVVAAARCRRAQGAGRNDDHVEPDARTRRAT